jgi:hypothetical protein
MHNRTYHIAQINVARLIAPIDNPKILDFVANLDQINSIAESYKGFVWRLKDDSGNATSMKIFEDPLIIVNMSVWETIEDLFDYTYSSDHIDVFRRRGEWFEKHESQHLALWWIPSNSTPSAEDGKEKLQYINDHGPTPFAFTFKKRFTIEAMKQYRN